MPPSGTGRCEPGRGGWDEGVGEHVEHGQPRVPAGRIGDPAEAERIDREEDERYGTARGDELPEHLRTAEGRRKALKEAKERLARERVEQDTGAEVELEFDQEQIVARVQGREGWLRDAKRQLDDHRRAHSRAVPRDRVLRLLAAERRLVEELAVEREANRAYEAYRARGVMKNGRRFGGPPKPYSPPAEPEGKVNLTDPDCKNLKAFRGYVQGYNVQAAVTEQQIVIAAEVTSEPQDFGHLGPMLSAVRSELSTAQIDEQPTVVVADAGYWHFQQMDELAAQGVTVLIPPDSSKRTSARPGWDGGRYSFMRAVRAGPGRGLYAKRRATVEPMFAQVKFNRRIDRFLRRGHRAVRSEWRLATATHNLLKLHHHKLATIAG